MLYQHPQRRDQDALRLLDPHRPGLPRPPSVRCFLATGDVHFVFCVCYHHCMRRPWEPNRLIRDRNDLVELIADAVQLYLHQLSDPDAKAVAECVLQAFKMEGLSIRKRKAVKE